MQSVKARSYSRFVVLSLLLFQAVSLALILGWLYATLARSYAKEFQQGLDAGTAQVRLMLQERLNHALDRLRTCSGDNALRVSLMLGADQQVEEHLSRYRHPREGIHILVQDFRTGRIHGVPPLNDSGSPLLAEDQIRSFFAFGPRAFPYFLSDQCVFTATSAIRRKNELLGTALLLYVLKNDQVFAHGRRPDRLIGYRSGPDFVDLYGEKPKEGLFIERDKIPGLTFTGCPQGKACYVTCGLGSDYGLSVAVSLQPLLERRAHLLQSFAILYVLVMAATCLVGFVIYRRIDQPLKALVRHTEKLAQTPSPNFIRQETLPFAEFRTFAASFNKMLQSFLDLQRRLAARARERLEESERRYRTLVETSPLGIVTVDSTGRFRFANPAALGTLGFDPGDLENLTLDRLLDTGLLRRFRERLEGASRDHDHPVETRLQRKDGRPVWVEILARWTREADEDLLMLTLVDITQRKSAEEERERLIAAVEQVPEAILITDQDRRILYANRAFELIFGYDRREAIGRNLRSLLATPRSRGVFIHVQEALQRGETWKGVVGNRTASGEEVEMETSVTPILGEDGRLRHIVYVKRDVTQERRMERQLRQTQKLQAIGTLAGGIAHDFNNILSAILGSAQLALLMSEGNDGLRRPLERILQASQRASDMVRQILTFSRSEEKPFDNIRLLSVVEEALQLLRSSLPATIRMEAQLEVEDDGVFGDATQIHQVIMNLCTNAAHAMNDGHGVLEVKLTERRVSDRFQAEALGIAPGDYLCLSVRDTGAGIPPDLLDRIFEPFFTSKATGEGTGLGLSVVHGIVRSHGGGIEVQSRLGEGSVFRVYLPKSGRESAEKVDRTESCQIGPKRILVVDDEEMIREVTAEFLEADRHQVTTIGSPLDALSMLSDGAAPFDLLMVDHTMPDMTGVKFLEDVRGLGLSVPAVLCSGNLHGLSPSVRTSLGIQAVLQKPFSLEQLRAVLAELFGGESLGQASGEGKSGCSP